MTLSVLAVNKKRSTQIWLICLGLVLVIAFVFIYQSFGSNKVFALIDPTTSIPSDVLSEIESYDNNPTSECYANPAQQYDLVQWISLAGQPLVDQNVTLDNTGQANLQLNEVVFSCNVIDTPANVYAPTDSYPNGTGNNLSATGEEISSSNFTVDSGPSGGVLGNLNGTKLTVSRNNSSRYWFGTPQTFTYTNPGLSSAQTITVNMQAIAINQFGSFYCVAHGGVINPPSENNYNPQNIEDFGACDSLPVSPITITFNPSPSSTVTLWGIVSYNGAVRSGVTVQACDCRGNCQNSDGNATKGSGTTGSTGQYSLIVYSNKDTCISVASGAPPGSCTLNANSSYSSYEFGCEYEIKPVVAGSTPSTGWNFSYGTGVTPPPSGSINGSCSESPGVIYGDFYTSAQAPSPSESVTFSDNAGSVTVNVSSNVAPDTSSEQDIETGSTSYGTTDNFGPVPFTTYSGYTFTITSKWKDNTTSNGVVTHYYTVTSYQEEFTHWTYSTNLPSSSIILFSTNPVTLTDSYNNSNVFSPQSECDPSAPSVSGSASCVVGNVSYNAQDPDAVLSAGDVTYSVDNGASQPTSGGSIDMSVYDQLVNHTVVITVQDVNIFGQASNGAGWGTASTTVNYPPCYQPTCGVAELPSIVETNSGSFHATVILGFTLLYGGEPSTPSTMHGTLTDAYDGGAGYNPSAAYNTSTLSNTVTVPSNTTGNYPFTWYFNDPGAIGVPLNCNQQNGGGSPVTVTLAYQPYVRVYGGDVTAGDGFTAGTGACTQSTTAGIQTWNEDTNANPGGNYAGAGTQLAALAVSNIQGFVSADGAAAGLIPTALSFANTSDTVGGDNYGGRFAGSLPCIPDYYNAKVSSSATSYNCTGPVTINNAQITNASSYCTSSHGSTPSTIDLTNISSPTVVKVNGNVTVKGSGPGYNASQPWVNSTSKTVTTYPSPLSTSYTSTPAAPYYTDLASQVPAGQLGFLWTYAEGSPYGSALVNNPAYECVNVFDYGDPIWTGPYQDNYLCIPRSDGVSLVWSENNLSDPAIGPYEAAGYTCMSVNPLSAPQNIWSDNDLCYYAGGRDLGLFISYTGPVYGAYCTQMNEPGDTDDGPNTWEQLYLCEPLAGTPQRPAVGGSPWTNVVGRVTFADGQPISGVQVAFCDWYYSGAYGAVTATTNAEGYYNAYPFYTEGGGASLCIRISDTSNANPAIPAGESPTAVNDPPEEAGAGSYECQFPGANEYETQIGGCGGISSWDVNSDDYYDFTYPSPPTQTTTTTTNTDSLNVPSLYVVAKGNIYVDPSVTSMSGIYVAENNSSNTGGSIYTCNYGNGTTLINSGSYYGTCDSQLVVNGALVANSIQLERTYSTSNKGTAGDTAAHPGSGWNDGAEVINYTPEVWLSNPFSLNYTPYDALSSLPPVL